MWSDHHSGTFGELSMFMHPFRLAIILGKLPRRLRKVRQGLNKENFLEFVWIFPSCMVDGLSDDLA
jgi:hypothetical protein